MKYQILITEDDEKLNHGIRLALKGEDYFFFQCRTLAEARQVIRQQQLSLILLDVNLPDGSGIDLVRELRRDQNQTPIILITVNSMELDVVAGLGAGANDYIAKPFSLMVLRARVAVQLRDRSQTPGSAYCAGPFQFDFHHMRFYKDGHPIELSKTEQKLLQVLCDNQGATVSRSRLIDLVWQEETQYVDEHALTVAVKRLRNKLEDDPSAPVYIKTIYSIGYSWRLRQEGW